ncbi:hypothetical protein ACIBTZ_20365 [Micromonospora sp. NPDC049460]|uniref:hypothetical protein n=1 Tax=Micromonospora sp. NPDC049460 TaxID=3364272 RepID=UPI0037BA7904
MERAWSLGGGEDDAVQQEKAGGRRREAGPYQRVERRVLPCGPAVVVLAGSSTPIPTRLGAQPEPAVVPVAHVQAVVPLPDAPYPLVLRLTSLSLADWAEYCQTMVSILRSVRFEQRDPAP